jgi:multidrug efflux pump subunit AcrA (membrane-fusion protein)
MVQFLVEYCVRNKVINTVKSSNINISKPVIGFCLILLFSCSDRNDTGIVLTSRVERRDYVDKITVAGNLESIKTFNIAAPDVWGGLTIIWLVEEGTYVKKGDTVCILEALELEEDYSNAVVRYDVAVAEYNKSKADLNLQYLMLESQVNTIDISTSISRLDSLQLQFTSPLERRKIELELEKAEIEREKLLNKLKFLKTINESEMKKMELRIKQQQNRINRAVDQLKKLILTSTVDGMVIYSRSWQTGNKIAEGDEIWGRMPLLEIPRMDQVHAKLLVNETHFKQIDNGQEVEVIVDARPDLLLGGKILRKSPMGKPIRRGSQVKVYEVIASLDSASVSVQPGLSISCDVFINRITDTLVVPTISVFEKDSIKLVYVEKGKKFSPRTVEIARGNNQFTVIKAGLTGSEVVATSKPPESLILN